VEPDKGNLFKNLIKLNSNKKMKNLFKDIDYDNHSKKKIIDKINKDLELLNKKDFEIFNYRILTDIFLSHFEELITTNETKSNMKFFLKEENSYDENKINKLKIRFKKLEMLQNKFEKKCFDLIIDYENEKKNFSETSFLKCLDEHNLECNSNYGQMLIRSLIFSLQDNKLNGIFMKINLVNLLRLLQYDTVKVQKIVLQMYEINKKYVNFNYLIDIFLENFVSVLFTSLNPSASACSQNYFICLLIIKILKYLCEEHNKDFQKIFFQKVKISYFLNEEIKSFLYNLSKEKFGMMFEENKEKENEKHIDTERNKEKDKQKKRGGKKYKGNEIDIDEFEFNLSSNLMASNKNNERENDNLDNENNINLNSNSNDYNDNIKNYHISNNLSFFEFMLCISQKIILLSKWDSIHFNFDIQYLSKENSTHYFSDIFSAIIELLIEMIQGTDEQNISSISLDFYGENNKFVDFLYNSKSLLYHNDHNSRIVNNHRRNLIEFLIAFLEDKSTPKKSAATIATIYSPNAIIETIIKIMKKIFVEINPKYEMNKKHLILMYNSLFFDDDLRDFFKTTFFEKIDFCKNEDFQLAIRLFQALKLLACKYNNAEANRILNIENRKNIEKKFKERLDKINIDLMNNNKNDNNDNKNLSNYNIIKNNYTNLNNLNKEKGSSSYNNKFNNINNDKSSINDIGYQRNFISSINNNNFINNIDNKNGIDENVNDINNNYFTKEFEEFLLEDKYFSNYKLERTKNTMEYEIINAIDFFECVTRQVYVQNENDENFVLFTLNPQIPYLSKGTIEEFYLNVNRDSRYTKLYSLMEYCEYFQIDINYNYERSKRDFLFVLLNKINWKKSEIFVFLILFIINSIMISNYQRKYLSGIQPGNDFVIFFGILNLILNFLILISWFYTKFNLYTIIETKKYLSINNIESEKELKRHERYFVIPIMKVIISRNEANAFIWNIFFSLIALLRYEFDYFYCVQTLISINLSVTLKILTKAVFLKWKQLLACFFSLTIVVFFFSSIAYFFLKEDDFVATLQNVKN